MTAIGDANTARCVPLQGFLREELRRVGGTRGDGIREGFDRALWKLMADQLGLQGLLIPDRFAGNELGFVKPSDRHGGDGACNCLAAPSLPRR